MGFLDFFRRAPAIETPQALAEFINRQAAFLMQKGIYEYSRARAGHYAKVLFKEADFQAAVETSRWTAFPLGLLIVAEMVEGELRPHCPDKESAMRGALSRLALGVFDVYPVPPSMGEPGWAQARRELAEGLARLGLHARKAVKDIPEPFAEKYFDLMPIHKSLRVADAPTIRNYLRVSLINIQEQLMKRADLPALARALLASA